MKCSICRNNVGETFLKKLIGTYIKKAGKNYLICRNCQKTLNSKEAILAKV